MKKIFTIIILAIVSIGAYIIFISNRNYNITPAMPVPNPIPDVIRINVRDFSFNPPMLTIKTGTTVAWVNNDSASHTVTSDSGNLLNSPIISPGKTFSFIFNNPGTVNYHCNIHKMMKGAIIVEK